MARVPITVIGCRCERCEHEWVPRNLSSQPRVCPKCKSPYWDRPKRKPLAYEEFRDKVRRILQRAPGRSLTWTEIRTAARLPQLFPNNRWVRQLESDIALSREKDPHGIIRWRLPGRGEQ